MKLSLCLVNYYSERDLLNFLESFADFRPECLYEVIVVNNGSTELNLNEMLHERCGNHIQVIEPKRNLGFGAAQNRAVKKAKGDWVFLVNPDIEVRDRSLEHLLEFAESEEKLGIVGPRLYHEDGSMQSSARRFPSFFDLVVKRLGMGRFFQKRLERHLYKGLSMSKPTKVDWLVGAAMLMKRERFLEVGGFDERFFLFMEDTDLCRRMKEKGYEVWFDPRAEMIHSQERLSARGWWPFRKVFWIHFSSVLKYFWKWRGK